MNGICVKLELGQRPENEYRCHTGQCISELFALESLSSVGCSHKRDDRDIHVYARTG